MKKIILLIQLLAIIIFFGCAIQEKDTGSVSLKIALEDNVSKLSKTIIPDIDMTIDSYDILLTGPDEESVTESTDVNGEITISDLNPGEWEITVTARNGEGQAIGGKTETIQILSNAVTNCEIIVIPYSGFGTLSLTVTWDNLSNTKTITGTIESSTGIIAPVEFTLDEGNNIYTNEFPAGYYTLNIIVYDDGEVYGGAMEVVRIIEGETAEAIIYITEANADGDAGIVIIPEMNDPIEITLSGGSETVTEGNVFTITAEAEDISGGIYSWYIDGAQMLSGEGETSYTIPNNLEVGSHRLDAVVFSPDGLRGGSMSCIFEVVEQSVATQIIADHTVVDKYTDIPDEYISIVKTWLVDIAGESHSAAYRDGCVLLESLDSEFQVSTFDGTIPAVTSSELRIGRHATVGEAGFYTNNTAITTIKNKIKSQHDAGNPLHVLGFGWCWDMTWTNAPGGDKDPVYGVHWAGSSDGGPEGNLIWGLDAGDEALTGNSVCMDTYLNAVTEYINYCETNGYDCKPIFTTGPVDNNNSGTENGFQREIKQQYIRDFVAEDSGRILFDYADILCYNDYGELSSPCVWNDDGTDRIYYGIHSDNDAEDTGHISNAGALRL
ncbi:MAG: hypothetical protein JW864_15115, partial [Spirochaetes bacterium]|nr:hypothetical protein [Spirochaetota bacterium]